MKPALRLVGVFFLGILVFTSGDAIAQRQSPADEQAVRLVFFGQTGPVLMRLHVTLDEQPIVERFNDYLRKWFVHMDANGDGVLDAAEAQHAPTAQALMQFSAVSAFFTPAGLAGKAQSPPFRAGRMGVTSDDFKAYYRRAISPIRLEGQSEGGAFQKQVSETLFRTLDANSDGKLSKNEVANAANVLRRYDLEDTEWITDANLAPGYSQPAQRFLVRQQAPQAATELKSDHFFEVRPGDGRLPAILIGRYGAGNTKLTRMQIGMDADSFGRLDADGDGALDAAELARWHERPADVEVSFRLAKTGGGGVQVHKTTGAKPVVTPLPIERVAPGRGQPTPFQPAAAGPTIFVGGADISLMPMVEGTIFRVNNSQRLLQIVTAAAKEKGFVTLEMLQKDRALQQLVGYFALADRDRNGKMTEIEMKALLDLQAQGAEAVATLSIAEQGRAFFPRIDANKDSKLSLRELYSAWTRLSQLDANGDGFIEESEIARQFQISAQKGQANAGPDKIVAFALGRPGTMARPMADNRAAPPWFFKMDKNGDGDISRREFLGQAGDFLRIDADGDGLISAEEARRFDPRVSPPVRRER